MPLRTRPMSRGVYLSRTYAEKSVNVAARGAKMTCLPVSGAWRSADWSGERLQPMTSADTAVIVK